MVKHYDANASYIDTATRWTSTVLPFVLKRKEFWIFMGLNMVIKMLYHFGPLDAANVENSMFFIDWNEIKIISAITTFFEVFYSNQTYSRYLHLYDHTRKLFAYLNEFTYETSLHLRETAPKHALLASRFFLCAVMLYFLEMWNLPSEKKWKRLTTLRLIKPEEKAFLRQFGLPSQRCVALLMWSCQVVVQGHSLAVEAKKSPANALMGLYGPIIEARNCMQEIQETLDLPLPFQYFHLLNVMITVNLFMWAYGMGVTDSIWAPVVFFMAMLIFMGMMELASQLSDPFGEDDTDFPIAEWLEAELDHADVMHCYQFDGERDGFKKLLDMEKALCIGPDLHYAGSSS